MAGWNLKFSSSGCRIKNGTLYPASRWERSQIASSYLNQILPLKNAYIENKFVSNQNIIISL